MKKLLGIVAATLLGIAMFALPASAAPETAFCVLPNGGQMSCYSTQAEMLRVASGGRINLSDKATALEVDAAIERSNAAASKLAAPTATVIQANLWTGQSKTGNQLTLTASALCTNGGAGPWTYFNTPWANNIESTQLYAGCYGRGYHDPNLSPLGASYGFGYEVYASTLGGFNNQMNSFKSCAASC